MFYHKHFPIAFLLIIQFFTTLIFCSSVVFRQICSAPLVGSPKMPIIDEISRNGTRVNRNFGRKQNFSPDLPLGLVFPTKFAFPSQNPRCFHCTSSELRFNDSIFNFLSGFQFFRIAFCFCFDEFLARSYLRLTPTPALTWRRSFDFLPSCLR